MSVPKTLRPAMAGAGIPRVGCVFEVANRYYPPACKLHVSERKQQAQEVHLCSEVSVSA